MKTNYLFQLMLLLSNLAVAQATYVEGSDANQLASELSANNGFTLSNPVITNGATKQSGTFSNGANAGLTLDRGIILTTGEVGFSLDETSNKYSGIVSQPSSYVDSDLTTIETEATRDAVIYEFDFTINGNKPKIFALDYQFASEEYDYYVCSKWNDIFGFFISGGDLTGTTNLAIVEGNNVAVNYINGGAVGGAGNASLNPCELGNSTLFVDNESPSPGPHHMVYDGFTTKLRAYTVLRPGITYHMKMAIADTADRVYDSAVFINPIQIFPLPPKSDIDFDGLDDFVNTRSFLEGKSNASMAAWFKLDSNFSSIGDISGQENFRFFVDDMKRLKVSTITNGVTTTTPDSQAPTLIKNQWYHVAATYNGITGELKMFLNGEKIWETNSLGSSLDINFIEDFAIGKNMTHNNNHFKGAIDEVKVFDVTLNTKQIQEQIYQEIKNIGGLVTGAVVQKPIDNGSLAWSNLILYYNMDLIYDITLIDRSNHVKNGIINNITSVQEQTAPLPYVANASGAWTTTGTWKHGNVWDIENLPNKDWAIVQVTNNAKVTTTNTHTHLGLIIDSGSELEIQNNQLLNNTSYLKLDGQLDLVDEAQFIQTMSSDLDITSSGYLERDQQGKADIYSYNHWSSPVSTINSLANNTDYSLSDILRDGTDPNNPQPIIWNTSNYNGAPTTPITLADYWIFKYVNQSDDYGNWFNGHVRSTGTISTGEGYTQKGSGRNSNSQNYVFVGKPNNGTIKKIIDGGNVYLVGNPYPSAIDANQFILDNITDIETTGDIIGSGTSTGALYFWEHWGGASHALANYQGGYATYNLLGATLAVPDPDVSSNGTGSVLPQRYIPVGQGFFVEGSPLGGAIEFNNGQRVFQREMDGNSVFISTNISTPIAPPVVQEEIAQAYFRFTTPDGPQRQLLLGVRQGLSEGINYGYDAKMLDIQYSDCSWKVGDTKLVIQGIGSIYNNLELPLDVVIGQSGTCKFHVESLANLDDDIAIYFVDKVTNTTTLLGSETAAEFALEAGQYSDRFYVLFKIIDDVLSIEEESIISEDEFIVYYNSNTQAITLESNKAFTANNITLYNMLGQQVNSYKNQFHNVTKVSLPTQVASGTYIVQLTYNNTEINTKVLIK